ncbi:hypothetical protein B0H14DRAFT_3869602 [Mycena olivaceomarginata]|nr:hypothetical protein B0H14DRAFT_3869602 [Mycena olivaceomarginata]
MRLSTLFPVSSAFLSVAVAVPLLEAKVDALRRMTLDEFVELDVTAEGVKIPEEISMSVTASGREPFPILISFKNLDTRWIQGGNTEAPSTDRTANSGTCTIA